MPNEPVETIQYKNHTIEILPDENSENPIHNWDMLGEYFCWHKQYNIGNSDRFETPAEVIAYVRKTRSLLFNLYMYDHSAIVLSLSNRNYPFNDQWDAGQLGFILVDREMGTVLEVRNETRMYIIVSEHPLKNSQTL